MGTELKKSTLAFPLCFYTRNPLAFLKIRT